MKILFVSALLPYPPRSGGQIRMYNLLKRLAKKHEITLVSFIRDEKERALANELRFCRNVVMVMRGRGVQSKYLVRSLTRSYSLLLATYDNEKMRETLAGLMEKQTFDLVHLEPFYVWPSVPQTNVPIIICEHNIEYKVYEDYVRHFPIPFLRPFLFLDVVKLRIWEAKIWKRASKITAVSPQDATAIRDVNNNVEVVPNGVDLSQFPFSERRPKGRGPLILFVGDFRWFPNKEAATRLVHTIWPLIRAKFEGARLRIVGRNISPGLFQAVRRAGGEAREDVANIAKEYEEAHVLVAPHAIGGGSKFKMLEAMASGLPIVTTKEGVAGLAAAAGKHYLEAAKPDEYVAQIEKIWQNAKIRTQLTRNARQLVERAYTWDVIASTLDEVWRAYEKS